MRRRCLTKTYEMHPMPPLGAGSARKQHCHKTYQLFGSLSLHHKEQEAAGRPPAVLKSDSRRSLSADAS